MTDDLCVCVCSECLNLSGVSIELSNVSFCNSINTVRSVGRDQERERKIDALTSINIKNLNDIYAVIVDYY